MFLNKKKYINKEKKSISSFFNIPTLYSVSYLQTFNPETSLDEFKLVYNKQFKQHFQPSFRFMSSERMKNFFLLKKFEKKNIYLKNFKSLLSLSNNLIKTQKLHRFFILKRVNGGFKSSSLGFVTFMPKSLYKIQKFNVRMKRFSKLKKKHFLIKIKVLQRKKRFALKDTLRVNLVSSRKTRLYFKL